MEELLRLHCIYKVGTGARTEVKRCGHSLMEFRMKKLRSIMGIGGFLWRLAQMGMEIMMR